MNNEPVMVRTFVGALLGVLVVFGVALSTEQVEALLNLTDAALRLLPVAATLVGAWFARRKVYGPETAQKLLDRIKELEAADDTKRGAA